MPGPGNHGFYSHHNRISISTPALGQALPEYATVLALLAVICATSLSLMGENMSQFLFDLAQHMQAMGFF